MAFGSPNALPLSLPQRFFRFVERLQQIIKNGFTAGFDIHRRNHPRKDRKFLTLLIGQMVTVGADINAVVVNIPGDAANLLI